MEDQRIFKENEIELEKSFAFITSPADQASFINLIAPTHKFGSLLTTPLEKEFNNHEPVAKGWQGFITPVGGESFTERVAYFSKGSKIYNHYDIVILITNNLTTKGYGILSRPYDPEIMSRGLDLYFKTLLQGTPLKPLKSLKEIGNEGSINSSILYDGKALDTKLINLLGSYQEKTVTPNIHIWEILEKIEPDSIFSRKYNEMMGDLHGVDSWDKKSVICFHAIPNSLLVLTPGSDVTIGRTDVTGNFVDYKIKTQQLGLLYDLIKKFHGFLR